MAVTKRAGKAKAGPDQAPAKGPEKQVAQAGKAEGPYTDRLLQLALLAGLVAPWAAAVLGLDIEPEEVGKRLWAGLQGDAAVSQFDFAKTTEFWALLAVLSLPHVTYYFVWTRAKGFYERTKGLGEPFQMFAMLAHLIKIIQGAAVVAYFLGPSTLADPNLLRAGVADLLAFFKAREPFQLLLGAQLGALGQLFNYYVYKTIGEAGVYYGCRLGQEVPWVYGFPFSVVPHPQYLGATLSIWGGVVLFATAATVSQGIFAVGLAMTVFYAISSYVEQCL